MNRLPRVRGAAGAAWLLISAVAIGDTESVRPDPIRVTATRSELLATEVPAATTVLTAEEIQRGRTLLGLDEALNAVPGVFVQNRGNFAQDERISIRGFGARASFGIRGVAVIVDGIPQTLPDGQAQVDSIDLGAVERIEVLRGPASALYGNAAGGVIRITTQRGPIPAEAGVRQTVGAFGLVRTQLSGGGRWRDSDFYLSANRLKQDGFRAHSAVEQYQLGGKWRWQPGPDTHVVAVANLFDSPTAQDPGGVTKTQARADPDAARDANVAFDAGESVDQQKLGLSVEHGFGGATEQRIHLAGFYLARDFDNRLPFTDGGQVDFNRDFAGADFRYQLDGSLAGYDHRLTAGVDHRRQNDDRRRFDNLEGIRGDRVLEQRERVTSTGIYLQQRLELDADWALTAGVRWDRVELDVDDSLLANGDDSGRRVWEEISPGAGLTWNPAAELNAYANVGTAFQTPTTTELANPQNPGSGGGFNRELEPQTARNYEIGLRGQFGDRLRYEAAAFRTRIDDAITSFEVPDFSGSGRDFFRNAGRSTRKGIELMLVARPLDEFSARLSYAYSDFTFDRFTTPDGDFSGNRLPGVPEHKLDLRLGYENDHGVFVETELLAVSDFFADNANSVENDGYARVDLRAGRTWTSPLWRVRGFVGINNILDARYNENVRVNAFGGRFFEPAPGRHAYLGFEIARLLSTPKR